MGALHELNNTLDNSYKYLESTQGPIGRLKSPQMAHSGYQAISFHGSKPSPHLGTLSMPWRPCAKARQVSQLAEVCLT